MPITNKNELCLFHLANFRNTEITNMLSIRHPRRHRGLSTALIHVAHPAKNRSQLREIAANRGELLICAFRLDMRLVGSVRWAV
jgi:hypothetical protein